MIQLTTTATHLHIKTVLLDSTHSTLDQLKELCSCQETPPPLKHPSA